MLPLAIGWLIPVLGMVCAAIVALWWRHLRSTGLNVVFPWVIASTLVYVLHAVAQLSHAGDFVVDSLCIAAATATATICVAVMGARGPRAAAWHIVIITFLVVLMFPVLEQAVTRRFPAGGRPALDWLRVALLILLNLLLAANYAASTLRWPIGAFSLSGAVLALLTSPWGLTSRNMAAAAEMVGLLAIMSCAGYRHRRPNEGPLQCRWRLFRDLWGIAWAYRVQERFNEEMKRLGNQASIDWQTVREPSEHDRLREAIRTFDGLTRRFVPGEWFHHVCGCAGNTDSGRNELRHDFGDC